MSRNANFDKSKRQAVGIYRAASPHAFINAGVELFSGGDYRVPEGAKACYAGKPKPAVYDLEAVRVMPAAIYQADIRKRSGSDPRQRTNLTMSGIRAAGPKMKSCVDWTPCASMLIPRSV